MMEEPAVQQLSVGSLDLTIPTVEPPSEMGQEDAQKVEDDLWSNCPGSTQSARSLGSSHAIDNTDSSDDDWDDWSCEYESTWSSDPDSGETDDGVKWDQCSIGDDVTIKGSPTSLDLHLSDCCTPCLWQIGGSCFNRAMCQCCHLPHPELAKCVRRSMVAAERQMQHKIHCHDAVVQSLNDESVESLPKGCNRLSL